MRFSAVRGITALAALVAVSAPRAATIRVPTEAPTIQAGVDGASVGDTVLVAPGVYTGAGNHDIRITPEGATEPRNLVILGEGGPGVTILDIQGSGTDPRRGFEIGSGEGPETLIEGLTLRNGFMSIKPERYGRHEVSGGGMVFRGVGTSPTIRNCVFVSNHSQISGGAMEAETLSAPTIESCVFVDNTSLVGGAISLESNSRAIIRDCIITGNVASEGGGGISFAATATVERCVIAGNRAQEGGGVGSIFPAMPVLRNVIVWGNCATTGDNAYAQLTAVLNFECSAVDTTGGPSPGQVSFDAGCVFEDPLFCEPEPCNAAPTDAGDYRVAQTSPCLPGQSACGLIGALGAGCALEPIETLGWGRLKARFAR